MRFLRLRRIDIEKIIIMELYPVIPVLAGITGFALLSIRLLLSRVFSLSFFFVSFSFCLFLSSYSLFYQIDHV